MTDSAPTYSSRVINTYLKLLRARYPEVNKADILRYAGMKLCEVEHHSHWFNQEKINLFHEKCIQLTGNESISREAGRFAASPESLGLLKRYALSLAGPLKAFSLIGMATKRYTKASQYRVRKLSNTMVEITIEAQPDVAGESFHCEYIIGFFEAIVNIFNIGIPKIEHPHCLFKGGAACQFVVSWQHNRATTIKRLRDATLLLGTSATLVSLFIAPLSAIVAVLPVSALAILATGWLAEHLRAGELDKNMVHLWRASDKLTEQIELNYRNTQLSADIGAVLADRASINQVIESVASILETTLDYDRGLILIDTEDRSRLEIRHAYGYIDQHLDILTNISFSLDKPTSQEIFIRSYQFKKPFLINNVEESEDILFHKSLAFAQVLGTQSFICVPIVLEGKSIGILAVDNLKTKKPLLMSDVNLLMGITPAIAVSIQNARLHEARAAQFDSTLRVLADSIDARDFLTAGHSEKVAVYAVGIAEELGLSEEDCRIVRLAALLHDYGKIAIPDSILKKDGPLTEEERDVIRTHPTKSRQILEKVAFEGSLKGIPAICQAHHERWDGSGYPNALKGEEIPLGARIIAAADFYEAITAERHYRAPMSADRALETFQEESGKYFQPEVAAALTRYLELNTVCIINQKEQGEKSVMNPCRSPRQQRIPYRTEVSINAEQKIITGTNVNISLGGSYISSDEADKLLPNTKIQVTFNLPITNELVKLQGEVAWLNLDKQFAKQLPSGFGIQFDRLDQRHQDTLHNYVGDYLNYGSQMTH